MFLIYFEAKIDYYWDDLMKCGRGLVPAKAWYHAILAVVDWVGNQGPIGP